jgi:hypothetical protein
MENGAEWRFFEGLERHFAVAEAAGARSQPASLQDLTSVASGWIEPAAEPGKCNGAPVFTDVGTDRHVRAMRPVTTSAQTLPNIPIISTLCKLSSHTVHKLDASLWGDGGRKIFPKISLRRSSAAKGDIPIALRFSEVPGVWRQCLAGACWNRAARGRRGESSCGGCQRAQFADANGRSRRTHSRTRSISASAIDAHSCAERGFGHDVQEGVVDCGLVEHTGAGVTAIAVVALCPAEQARAVRDVGSPACRGTLQNRQPVEQNLTSLFLRRRG